MSETIRQSVLSQIIERTEPEPDGEQNAHGNLWTSRDRLRGDAKKPHTEYDKDTLTSALDALEADGKIVSWYGLLAPATEDYLQAIIQNEADCESTRSVLVGLCNSLRQGGVAP